MLVRESNKDILARLLRQLQQVLFKLFRLRLLETLGNNNEALLEELLLDIDALVV